MSSRLARILCLISLLLLTATLLFWRRSYGSGDSAGWITHKTEAVQHGQYREEKKLFALRVGCESRAGRLAFGYDRMTLVKTSPAIFAEQWSSVPDADHEFRWTAMAPGNHYPFQYLYGGNRLDFETLGFAHADIRGAATEVGTDSDRLVFVQTPYWFLALLTAAWPIFFLLAFLRRRQQLRRGLCPICGYDLRATPMRCPECGTAALKA